MLGLHKGEDERTSTMKLRSRLLVPFVVELRYAPLKLLTDFENLMLRCTPLVPTHGKQSVNTC